MKAFILPHGASNGAAALADALGVKRIKRENSSFRPCFDKLVINWGNSLSGRLPKFMAAHANWLNNPAAVERATDKHTCWDTLAHNGVPTVAYTADLYDVAYWLRDGHDVILRTKLKSSAGGGIIVLSAADYKGKDVDSTVRAIFEKHESDIRGRWAATRYFKAKQEFRVHVMGGKVIDVQEKRKRSDVPREQVNYMVRSHDNGFVFCREDVDLPDAVASACVAAVSALGLDFGAVDVRWNATNSQACVLEVNTAPGLEGTTVEKYSQAIAELISQLSV